MDDLTWEYPAVVVLGFAVAILLIGTPLALLARGVHEVLSWLLAW